MIKRAIWRYLYRDATENLAGGNITPAESKWSAPGLLRNSNRATSEVLRELVRKIAKETSFGYTKNLGELRRLRITRICRQVVRAIVKEEGIGPSPKRSQRIWDEFLTSHAERLWSCDLFSVKTVTRKSLFDLYVLVFLHGDSRRLIVSPATTRPDSTCGTEQATAFRDQLSTDEQQNYQLIHDRGTKFSGEFRETMKDRGVTSVKMPVRSRDLDHPARMPEPLHQHRPQAPRVSAISVRGTLQRTTRS